MALVDLDLKLKGMETKIVNTMHGKIIIEAKAEIAEEVALILKETMEEAGRSFLKINRLRLRWLLWTVGQRNDTGF